MNWKQLYISATPNEREEILLSMLQTIETRQSRLILITPLSINALLMGRGQGWGLIRERRAMQRAHFINDRRRLRPRLPQIITRLAFISILLTVFMASWLFIIYAPPQLTAHVLLVNMVGLTAVLVIKPNKRKTLSPSL